MMDEDVFVLDFDSEEFTKDVFSNFTDRLVNTLAVGEKCQGVHVLPKPTSNIKLYLTDLTAFGVTIRVAMRSDNAYVIGFRNVAGVWFELHPDDGEGGNEERHEQYEKLIEGSEDMYCKGSHPDLLEFSAREVEYFALTLHTLKDAVKLLGITKKEDFSVDKKKRKIKAAFERIITFLAECSRFKETGDKLIKTLDGSAVENVMDYLLEFQSWRKVSRQLQHDTPDSNLANRMRLLLNLKKQ